MLSPSILFKPSPKITSWTNFGMDNQLVIIIEGLVDFEEKMAQGFDLRSVVDQKWWDGLFDML